jgi:hypothetical protein
MNTRWCLINLMDQTWPSLALTKEDQVCSIKHGYNWICFELLNFHLNVYLVIITQIRYC